MIPASTRAPREAKIPMGALRSPIPFLVFFCAYAIFLVVELPRYGLTFDVPYEFSRATAYVERFLSGRTDPLQSPPERRPPWHVLSWDTAKNSLTLSLHASLPSMIAAVSGKLFFEKLGLLGAVDAFHLGLTILWLGLLVYFYLCLRQLHDGAVALLASIVLALAPRVVGEVHNNMKDVPAMAFSTLALLEVAVAVVHARPRRLYAAATLFGCALASKLSAATAMVPAAVLLLLWHRAGGLWPRVPRGYWVPLVVAPLVALSIVVACWPYLWALPPELWDRLENLRAHLGLRVRDEVRISSYPLAMVLYTTPPAVLALALASLTAPEALNRQGRATRFLYWYYAGWLAWVLFSFSVSRVQLFDGIRHFLLVWPPLAILAAVGAVHCGRWLGRGGATRRLAAGGGLVLLGGSLVHPLVRYHPYEVTYFNALVGGLPGATTLDFGDAVDDFEARDYWGTSLRAAVGWANAHLPAGAYVSFGVPPMVGDYYELRADLQPVEWEPGTTYAPHYAIFICRSRWYRGLEHAALERGEPVYEVEVEGVALSVVYRLR